MQVNVLGAERRRRWSYDEKVRLVEETLQAGETVCGVARRHGVAHSHAGGGSGLERRATTSLFPACAACKDWNHRD